MVSRSRSCGIPRLSRPTAHAFVWIRNALARIQEKHAPVKTGVGLVFLNAL